MDIEMLIQIAFKQCESVEECEDLLGELEDLSNTYFTDRINEIETDNE